MELSSPGVSTKTCINGKLSKFFVSSDQEVSIYIARYVLSNIITSPIGSIPIKKCRRSGTVYLIPFHKTVALIIVEPSLYVEPVQDVIAQCGGPKKTISFIVKVLAHLLLVVGVIYCTQESVCTQLRTTHRINCALSKGLQWRGDSHPGEEVYCSITLCADKRGINVFLVRVVDI